MKAQGVLRIGIAPPAIRESFHHLERNFVAQLVLLGYEISGGAFKILSADVSCLEHRTKCSLRCNRISGDKLSIRRHHTAEILRPRTVSGRVYDGMADPLRSQLLQLWRESKESVGPTFHEHAQGIRARRS